MARSLTRLSSPHVAPVWCRDRVVSIILSKSRMAEHKLTVCRLVATLGSKSGLKKVSRKAILDVDVQKACEAIVAPAAPMALRLQSNLLYVPCDARG